MNCSPVSLLAVLTASTTSVSTEFLPGFSCILAWYCWQHVVASECPLLYACKGTAWVITTAPGKVSVVTLSLRRLNSSALFPSSCGNWCQFPGSFLLPSTLIHIPVPVFLLMAALRLASLFLYSSNTTLTRWTDFMKWLIYILREWIRPDRFQHVAIATHRERSCPLQALINKLFASSVCSRRTFRDGSRSDFVDTLNFPVSDIEGGNRGRVTTFWDSEKGGVMKNGPLKEGGSCKYMPVIISVLPKF